MSTTEASERALHLLMTKQLLPRLLEVHREPATPLRIWSIGCQAGDEALLLVLRLVSAQKALGVSVPFTLIATDPDTNAVSTARRLASSPRLETVPTLASYRSLLQSGRDGLSLPAPLRDSLIFGPHRLLRDVPFSRLDLIVCTLPLARFPDAQQGELLQRLAYGLVQGGLLVLLAPGDVLPEGILYQPHRVQPVPFYERTRAPASLVGPSWNPRAAEAPAASPPAEETQAFIEGLQTALQEQLVRTQELEAWAQAYRQAEEAELYLAALVSSSEDAILSKDLEGTLTSWNAAAERLYGYRSEEVMGKSVLLLFPPDRREEFVQIMSQIRQGKRVEPYETVRQRKDGRLVEVSVAVSPIKRKSGALIGASAIARDITERKALECQREANELLKLVTHDLRNPLTSLQGNLQLAQRHLTSLLNQPESLTEAQRRTLDEVLSRLGRSYQQGRLEQRMIDDLLDFARLEHAQLTLHLSVWNLVELVAETVQDFQDAYPDRLLTVDLPEEEVISVFVDRDRLGQVLSNYLTNALQFAPDALPVCVGVAREEDQARVWVQDRGPGLTPDQQTHIWERFYQVSQTPLQPGWKEGLGLGLSISEYLIERQQGQVGVESVPGQGATFWFTLPVHGSSASA
jgi:PAS domain S-box-containing protein